MRLSAVDDIDRKKIIKRAYSIENFYRKNGVKSTVQEINIYRPFVDYLVISNNKVNFHIIQSLQNELAEEIEYQTEDILIEDVKKETVFCIQVANDKHSES